MRGNHAFHAVSKRNLTKIYICETRGLDATEKVLTAAVYARALTSTDEPQTTLPVGTLNVIAPST